MTQKKYEREIAEILERLEREEPLQSSAPRRAQPAAPHFRPPRLSHLSLRLDGVTWLALAFGLPLLGTLVHRLSPTLGVLLVLAGIAVFFTPLVLQLVARGRGYRRDRTLWRGQIIEMPGRRDSLAATWRYQVWLLRQRWERWRDRR